MSKEIRFGHDAKKAIKAGVDKTANAVRVTLGPTGRTVILDHGFGPPIISDDGVTVARSVDLKDKFENVGASLIQEVANQTNEKAGDGTTTATVLAQKMIAVAFDQIISTGQSQGAQVKAGMDAALAYVIDRLKVMATKITTKEETEQVAVISSLDIEVGKLIAEAMEEVGPDGVITVEESQSIGIEKEVVKGMRFDQGFLSPYFMTNPERGECMINDADILVTDKILGNIQDLVPFLQKYKQGAKENLVIIASDVTGDALASLVLNKMRGVFNVVCIKAPGFTKRREYLSDIAALTGAKYITEDTGAKLDSIELADLGHARTVTVTREHSTIVGGEGSSEAIEVRIAEIKNVLEETKAEYDKELLRARIAKLTGGIGVIKVGAFTETELRTKKFKIEDALNATKAAREEGIVPGGGVALAKIACLFDGMPLVGTEAEKFGWQIVFKSLDAPILQMAENAGIDGVEVLMFIRGSNSNEGYDFKTGKPGDLIDLGIIDPVKVTRLALENAVSIASTMITAEAIIVDEPEDKDKPEATQAF